MKVIVYQNDEGGVAVVYPTPEALALMGIQAIAHKDVPPGKPFKILDQSELPDRELRAGWRVDVADLTDGVGGYPEQPQLTLEDEEPV